MEAVEDVSYAAAFARGLEAYTRARSGSADEVRVRAPPPPFAPFPPPSQRCRLPPPPPPQIRDRASLARAPSLTPALPTPSPSQDEIASGLTALRAAASKVDSAGVFSRGETKDDIATRDLRYLLTHHYVAELASRARAADPALRLRNVVEAKEAHAAFLALCERHEALTATAAATLERERERDAADSAPSSDPSLDPSSAFARTSSDPAADRAAKVARFKRSRAIRERLEALDSRRVERRRAALAEADWDDEDPEGARDGAAAAEDDADDRERWLLLLEAAVDASLDARATLDAECEMLRRRDELEARRKEGEGMRDRSAPRGGGTGAGNYVIGPGGSVAPLGEFVGEARESLMRQLAAARGLPPHAGDRAAIARGVFRPGHILPTMTIEEAGEMEYRELTERTARERARAEARAKEEAGLSAEEREARALAKARAWDEFKDDNPFGAGNSKLRPCS